MTNQTRKRIWPVALMSLAVFGVLAAVVALSAMTPQPSQAHGCDQTNLTERAECERDHVAEGIDDSAEAHTHNAAPTAVGTIPAVTVTAGMSTEAKDVSMYFNDADAGDTLTYEAESSDEAVATVAIGSPFASSSMLVITGVAAGTATVTVTATDEGGESATQSVMVTVESAVPAPMDFRLDSLDNGARLSWQGLPDSSDYTVMGYQIDRKVHHSDPATLALLKTGGGDATIDLEMVLQHRDLGLSYGTTYTYKVRAYVEVTNAAGEKEMGHGSWSRERTTVTADSGGRLAPLLEAPSAVRMLEARAACANSITVSWQEPANFGTVPATDDNGMYVGPDYIGGEGAGKEAVGEDATSVTYKVERMVDSGGWTMVTHTDMTYMDTKPFVTYGKIYNYRVRAMNGAQIYGPWTMVTVDLTDVPSAPNPPRSLNVDPVGNTVELQWDPPLDDADPLLWRTRADFDRTGNASDVLEYVIERRHGDDDWDEIRTQDHLYADNFADTLTQGYTDVAPPLGSVSYRVAALVDDCNRSPYNQKDPVEVINQAPVGQAIADQVVAAGSSVDVATSFTDADQATLDYSVTSSDKEIATVKVSDTGTVTVTGVAAGTATITVKATDSWDASASQSFTVTVRQAGLGMASNIRIGLNTGGVIQVTWDPAANAGGYIVIAISQVDNSVTSGAVNPGTDGTLPTTLNLAGLTSGERYFLYVATTGSGGDNTLSDPPADVTAN